MIIKDDYIAELFKKHKIELGKVYTAKDFPAFKTPKQIEQEKEK